LRVSNERTRLESDKMSVLRDRRPFIYPRDTCLREEPFELTATAQGHSHSQLGTASLLLPPYNTLQFIESKTQTSYFIFHRIDLQSSSFKFPSHHPSDTAQPQDPSYLQLEGDLEALLRCSTLLQHKSGKEKNILCSTELYCHSLTQHHGEMNGHIHTY
jgi:hypothetical protein